MVRCALFLVAVVCVGLVCADERTEKAKQILQTCFQETGATSDNLKAFLNGESYPDAFKCLFKCIMQAQKVMKEDGTIDAEAITKVIGEDKKESTEKCTAEATSADLCEKALQFNTCYLAAQPDYVKATVARIMA